MSDLIIPQHLMSGDKVAAVSLSWGGAGEETFRHRYESGKERLKEHFGVDLVAMNNALKGSEFIYNNPQARAADLMQAFSDPSIKGVIACIGGEDSVRILPHIDLQTIHNNPKIFMGYSDSTVTNFICRAAGVRSFNGPSVLTQFAENGAMHEYTKQSVQKTLFSSEIIGEVKPSSEGWTDELLKWDKVELRNQKRKMESQPGWNYIQGDKAVSGRLIGGCIEVLGMIAGTDVWPSADAWKDAILFIENSEDAISTDQFRLYMRNLQAQNILDNLAGIVFAKPCRVAQDKWPDYDKELIKLAKECGRPDMPIVTQMDFGHTDPIFILPHGAKATIDPVAKRFSIDEAGCAPRLN